MPEPSQSSTVEGLLEEGRLARTGNGIRWRTISGCLRPDCRQVDRYPMALRESNRYLRTASAGGIRAARIAGYSPANPPMASAARTLNANPPGGTAIVRSRFAA